MTSVNHPFDIGSVPVGRGKLFLIAAGYRPSPQFKPMLELAEDAQLEGAVTTREQALALVQSHFPLPQQWSNHLQSE